MGQGASHWLLIFITHFVAAKWHLNEMKLVHFGNVSRYFKASPRYWVLRLMYLARYGQDMVKTPEVMYQNIFCFYRKKNNKKLSCQEPAGAGGQFLCSFIVGWKPNFHQLNKTQLWTSAWCLVLIILYINGNPTQIHLVIGLATRTCQMSREIWNFRGKYYRSYTTRINKLKGQVKCK